MPRYFKPWAQGLPALRGQLMRLDDIKELNKKEKQYLHGRLAADGLSPDERNLLIMWGGSRRVVAVFDPATLQIKALLNPDLA
jgi:hypothetical protein